MGSKADRQPTALRHPKGDGQQTALALAMDQERDEQHFSPVPGRL